MYMHLPKNRQTMKGQSLSDEWHLLRYWWRVYGNGYHGNERQSYLPCLDVMLKDLQAKKQHTLVTKINIIIKKLKVNYMYKIKCT